MSLQVQAMIFFGALTVVSLVMAVGIAVGLFPGSKVYVALFGVATVLGARMLRRGYIFMRRE